MTGFSLLEYRYYWNEITRYVSYFSHSSAKVLEIGCAEGNLIGNIPGHYKTGIDSDPIAINKATIQFPAVQFIEMNAENICLDDKYDLIILSNLIGHLQDVQLVFQQIKKVCHSRTKIIITFYNFIWEPIFKLSEMILVKKKSGSQNWLSRSDIRNLLFIEGFDTYRETSGILLPFRIPLLSTFCNSFLAKLPFIWRLCINNYTFARLAEQSNTTADSPPSVSVIIPARNECGNIDNIIENMPSIGSSTELIFVEGNSSDGTWQKILDVTNAKYKHFTIKSFKQCGVGKNDAIKKGFDHATGDILMILDADLTVNPSDLIKFFNALISHKGDFINGCRLIYRMDERAMPILNLFGNKIFGMTFSWLLDQPIKDTLCGTKAMWRTDYELLNRRRGYFGNIDPFGDFDLIFGAYKLNLKIIEMPVRYHERTYGKTNISRFEHGLLLFKMCILGAKKIKFV